MKKLLDAAEKNRKLILDTQRYIWEHPETGYREEKTEAYMKSIFQKLGYEITEAKNIPGFYTLIDTGRPGPTVLVLGELDGVVCPEHKQADPQTGAVHACGHNIQCAALVGIAAALKEPDALNGLSGKIKLCAVPAEEMIELGYRNQLKQQGIIRYLSGKCEFLYRGYFDDVDMAFMVHASTQFAVGAGAVGCIAKTIQFKGKGAHAGGNPWDGINALYAANCGLNAINALRETFQEKDIIRVHPIITNGGAMVNAIPEMVTMDSFVRGASYESIFENNKKINRALCGAALSLGANVNILDSPGYAPLINDQNLIEVAREGAAALPNKEFFVFDSMTSGSTDMGDLSCVMPVVHPYIPGIAGNVHGADFAIVDLETACIGGAKYQLAMLHILLSDNAKRARKVVAERQVPFNSEEEYFNFIDGITCNGDRIEYLENGSVSIKSF